MAASRKACQGPRAEATVESTVEEATVEATVPEATVPEATVE